MNNRKLQIGVIGSAGKEEYPKGGGPSSAVLESAEKIGSMLAEKNLIVVTGGKGGIMKAVAKGAKKKKGLTVGVIKGPRFTSNEFIDIEVISGMTGDGLDELLLVQMRDVLIVLGGGAGTLQELAIAYRNQKPIVAIRGSGGWADKLSGKFLDERKTTRIKIVDTPQEAVRTVCRSLGK